MTVNRIYFLFATVLLLGGPSLRAAEPNARPNASSVMTEMRVRQLNKSLQLTEDQQKKVRALLAVEAEKISKIDESGLSLTERTVKVSALKKETQESIRPLLTPEQMAKFDAQNQQAEKRKKNA